MSQRAFVEQVLDMIADLPIPDRPSDRASDAPVMELSPEPFRALLAELSDDDVLEIRSDWLMFANALSARGPTRSALRAALLPLIARFELLDDLSADIFDEEILNSFRLRIIELTNPTHKAPSQRPPVSETPLVAAASVSEQVPVSSGDANKPTAYSPTERCATRDAGEHSFLVTSQQNTTTSRPGIISDDMYRVANCLRLAVANLQALAGDLDRLSKLDALDVLGSHPQLQTGLRTILEQTRNQPPDDHESHIRLAANKIRTINQYERQIGFLQAELPATPYIVGEMYRVADNLQSSAGELLAAVPQLDDERAALRHARYAASVVALMAVVCLAVLGWRELGGSQAPAQKAEVQRSYPINQSVKRGDISLFVSHGERLDETTEMHVHVFNDSDKPQPGGLTVDGAVIEHEEPASAAELKPRMVPPRSSQHRVIRVRDAERKRRVSIGIGDIQLSVDTP